MLNLIALHGQGLKLPRGWNTNEPGCWLEGMRVPFGESVSSGEVRWFNSEREASEFASSLGWWLMREVFPGLWRVEEMDGYR